MHIDMIEAINRDQLVTATDRILLRRGRFPRARRNCDTIARPTTRAASNTVLVRLPVNRHVHLAAFAMGLWLAFILTMIA